MSAASNRTVQIQEFGLTFWVHVSALLMRNRRSSESELNNWLAGYVLNVRNCREQHDANRVTDSTQPARHGALCFRIGCAAMIDAQTQAQPAQVGGGCSADMTSSRTVQK